MSEPLVRRSEYVPNGVSESFLVPRLAAGLNEALRIYAPRSGRVLDVGCGEQPLRRTLEARGMHYGALDIAQNRDGTVNHIGSLAVPLPESLAGQQYEFVLCTEVLEHVPDWPSAFAALHMLLTPGGRALLTTPFVYPLHEAPYDFWRPTPFALRHFAIANGLRIVHEQMIGDGGDVLGTLLETHWGYPRTRDVLSRVRASMFEQVRRWLLRRLHDPAWRAAIEIRGPLFHGVLLVVERPL
jgi:SAM-dependent methyltransferase